MARDNFISDNLIHIREKLRQEQNILSSESADIQQTEPINTQLPKGLPVPAPRMQVNAPEIDRERRALIGRIRRDYTLAAAELEFTETKKRETAAFMQFLAEQQKSVESLDIDRSDISRELDHLTWEYYQRAGRWKAFSSNTAENLSQQTAAAPPSQNNKLLSISIIISSMIISAAILAALL